MNESQLHELLDAHLAGELDEAGRTWLQVELAAADAETLRALADQMAIDRALRVHLGTGDDAGDQRVVDSVLAHLCLGSPEDFRAKLLARIGGRRPEQPVSPSRLAAVTSGSPRSAFRPWHAAVLTAAACFLVLVAMQFLGSRTSVRPVPPPRVAEAPAPPDPVDPWFSEADESRLRSAERMRREYLRRWFEQVGEAPPAPAEPPPPGRGTADLPKPAAPRIEAPPAPEPRPSRPAVAEVPEPAPERPAPEKPAPVVKDRSRESVVLEARVERAEGAVFVLTDQKRTEAFPMQALLSGHGVQTGRDGRASLLYADGTRLELEPGSTISLVDHRRGAEPGAAGASAGKGVFVVEGALAAEVARQPAKLPMILASPQAEVRVLGTRLVVSVNPAATQVEVREGRVRVTRRQDEASVEVAAGQFAVAAEGIPLAARPVLDTRGLLMWLRMDEGHGGIATDASGRGHHGFLKGGPKWAEGHAGGGGLRLEAAESIRVRGTPALRPDREVAVSLWVRPDAVDSGGSDVLSMGDSYAIRILGNGNVSFFFYEGTKWIVCTTKGTKVGDGRWHHIVGQKTARRLEVYVDGVLKGVNPTVAPIVYSLGSNFYVGRHGDRKTDFFFSGAVDDVRVYSRPLSGSEIRALLTAK